MSEILSNILPLILVVGVVVIKLVSGAKSASAQNNNAPTDEQGEDERNQYRQHLCDECCYHGGVCFDEL